MSGALGSVYEALPAEVREVLDAYGEQVGAELAQRARAGASDLELRETFEGNVTERIADAIVYASDSKAQAVERATEYMTNQLALEIQQEDIGWRRIGQVAEGMDIPQTMLTIIKMKCLGLWQISPVAGQAAMLTTSATFGRGVATPRCADGGIQEIVSRFWDDEDNRLSWLAYEAQEFSNLMLLIEGERFCSIHTSPAESVVKLADIPSQEITRVITHPENRRKPVLYERRWRPRNYDFKALQWAVGGELITSYYRDWSYPPERDDDEAALELIAAAGDRVQEDTLVYHLRTNTTGLRGIPEFYRSYDWIRAHDQSVSDLVTYAKALAMIAWMKKIDTRSKAVIDNATRMLREPVPGTGAVYASNKAVDMAPVNVSTGGTQNLKTAVDKTMLAATMPFGYGLHYYGDPSVGKVASADAMELPAIWRTETRQEKFRGMYACVTNFAIRRAREMGDFPGTRIPDDVDQSFTISFPEIEKKSDQHIGQLITALYTTSQSSPTGEPALLDRKEAALQAYLLIGTEDPEAILARQFPEGAAPNPPSPPSPVAPTVREGQGGVRPTLDAHIAKFAGEIQGKVINPWRERIVSWLKSWTDAPVSAEVLQSLIERQMKPDQKTLRSVLQRGIVEAGNIGGRRATERAREAIRHLTPPAPLPRGDRGENGNSRAAEALAVGDVEAGPRREDETLAEYLGRGGGWNTEAGGFTFNLRNPELLKELNQRGVKITGDVTQTMLDDLRAILAREFFEKGQSPLQVAGTIHDLFPATYANRAENIARTETLIAQSKVGHESYMRNGIGGHEWAWREGMLGGVRDEHQAADGQVKPIDEPFDVGGTSLMHPGDPAGGAEDNCGCCCEELPVVSSEDGLAEEPWEGE